MMKRKFPHNNFQTGQIDSTIKNNNTGKARSNYSNAIGNANSYQNSLKIERNKNAQCYLNVPTIPNNLNNKNTKKIEHINKKPPSNLYQKMQNDDQSKRHIDTKREKSEYEYSSTKMNIQQNQDSSTKKKSNSNQMESYETKKMVESKKSCIEATRNIFSVEESISTGIKMQLIYSLFGKSEFQSLTQLIFNLLNGKSVGPANKTDKSKCILFLDYLILRTKKLSYIIDSCIQDKSLLLRLLEKDRQEFELSVRNVKHIIYENIVESKNIQSFWHKCDILSEEINSIKNKRDIQNEIESEYESYNVIKAVTREKKINFNQKKKSIRDICLILSKLISK
ncbi:uncharacterized protein cubi_01828 [Cryptosporidium ubiquitum]|uniref:Uncharacterized protein n=1 Tax=Cryptosporidium ubiquitum TaxID=857276 RepID=A0A1J4MPD1_9CRYT|nr:uncharacterized protein cubi_01828 [Cryptosporidium ubiquitum]OII75307.1 hypothetical protein cubi_01828 [Cryptosporidium ubiquitum]